MKYALINGILLDGTETMQPRPGLSILVNGDRIEAIVPAGTEGSDYERIDLAGGYVMPGLINLHVHLPASGRPTVKQKDTKRIVRLMTSNALLRAVTFQVCAGYARTELLSGVTTLRSVGGIQAMDSCLRDKILSGKAMGPRILAGNMAVSVPGGHMAGSLAYEATSPEDAAALVRKIAEDKPDLIKLMITGGVLDAKEKGVQVINAPGLNGNAVAELTICKMLELSRHTIPAHRDVTVNQKWDKYAFVGRELRGKTLGVLGFGRIGQRVGEIARVFGMKVVAYDPYLPAEIFTKNEATSMSIAEVCEVADFVTIHMPLNDETRNLFNATSIAEMKSDAVVLNMARGGIVNEKDMYEALKAGKIGGYATDVLENEVAGDGLTEDSRFYSPLFDLDNFVVSPHIGAQTVDASRDIGQHIIAKVKEALNLGGLTARSQRPAAE